MNNFTVMHGHISPNWDLEFIKNLPWQDQGFRLNSNSTVKLVDTDNLAEYNKLGFSVIFDIHQNYPKEFEFINQHFWWLTNKHATLHKFSTGQTAGLHIDRYAYYSNKYDIHNDDQIFRVIIFLDDWKSGHYMEVDGKGIINWLAGDWVGWDLPTPHYPCNIGQEDRFTLQITGTKI